MNGGSRQTGVPAPPVAKSGVGLRKRPRSSGWRDRKRSTLTYMAVLLCAVTIVLLALPATVGAAPPDKEVGGEKPVIPKMPVAFLTPDGTAAVEPGETSTPAVSKEKNVTESEPDLVTWGITPGESATVGVPTRETLAPLDDSGVEEAPTENATAEVLVTEPVIPPSGDDGTEETPTTNATVGAPAAEVTMPPGDDGTEEMPGENATATPAPVTGGDASTDNGEAEPAVAADDTDDTDDDEAEATPTLEKDALPRPGATLAKSHKSHHRPLVLSTHQVVSPGTTYTPDEDRSPAASTPTVPRDGLIVSGVGVILDRTPGDVSLTRNGVETANLEWLLDVAMRLGGRHPRVAFEGETFTITVTVEARNTTITGDDPGFVVLVPPPCETGVYEITRTSEPGELRDGERAVWEFSVFTRTGRLTLEDLTLIEERRITSLTTTPDIFSFRAFALAGDQEHPSMGFSDPVIAIRPAGAGSGESSLPQLYTLVGIQDSTLLPSETIPDAWKRSISHDQIVTGAAGHLDTTKALGRGDLEALYAEEGMAGAGISATTSSLFDAIFGFFNGLLRMLTGGA